MTPIHRRIYDTYRASLSVKTGASQIKATTYIAEFGSTSAFHVITPICLFYPYSTARALLELRASHKLFEGLVEQVWITVFLKFFARLSLVSFRFAIQAIFFFAFDALEIFTISSFFVNKRIIAVWSGAP
jgi:hypothetical protein